MFCYCVLWWWWCCYFLLLLPAGQERFGSAVRVYFKDAVGVMLVYDISRPSTFETVIKWKDELDRRVLLSNGIPAPVILLGNKADLDSADVDKVRMYVS